MLDRIPRMIHAYHKPLTVQNILVAYNAGISYVRYDKLLPLETINYINKYKKEN